MGFSITIYTREYMRARLGPGASEEEAYCMQARGGVTG
jgi:hypothetical protein